MSDTIPAFDTLSDLRTALSIPVPVRAILWHGQRAWGKRRVPLRMHERTLLRLAPLLRRWLAPDTPFVPAVYSPDLPIEVQRLRALHKAGWHVPEVLAADRDVFVTADAGTTLGVLLPEQDNPDLRRQWLLEAARELAAFHAAGQWHGAAQLRNVVRAPDGKWGRIDFETELDRHLPLPLLQAFDASLLFTSIVRTRDRDMLPEIALAYRDQAPFAARDALRRGLPLVRCLARSRLLKWLAPKEAERLRALAALPLD